jgi:hypothetical protein
MAMRFPKEFRREVLNPRLGELPQSREDWKFGVQTVTTCGGQTFHLAPRPLACLRVFVAAGRPVTFDDLQSAAWPDRPGISRVTIKTTIHQLRTALKRELGLPDRWNPLPPHQVTGSFSLKLPPIR